jgi:hypothetical protein
MRRFITLIIICLAGLLASCNFQATPSVSEPLEPQANFWQQMSSTVGYGNPDIAPNGNAPAIAFVSEGTTNLLVKQLRLDNTWQPLGSAVSSGVQRSSLAFDNNAIPVVAYNTITGSGLSATYHLYVKKWNGSSWVSYAAGNTPFNIDATKFIYDVDLAIDSTGKPVVAWIEQSSGIGKVFIKRWTGTTWASYGSSAPLNITNRTANSINLALTSTNLPVMAWLEQAGTAAPYTNDLYVVRWNGTAWVQYVAGKVNSQNAYHPSLVIDSQNKPMVSWSERTSTTERVYVKRFDTSWTFFGTNPINIDSNARAYDPSLAIGSNGNPVIAWTELVGTPLSVRTMFAKRWSGTQWVRIGNSPAAGDVASLALDAANNPILTRNSEGGILVYRYITNGWQPLSYPLDTTLTNPANFSSMARTSNNRPIVAWQENVSATDRDVYVKEWTGTSWQNLGIVDRVSTNPARVPSIAVGTDNRPVVAWGETSFDTAFRNDIFVSRWNGTVWTPLGGRLSTVRNDEWPVVALDSANTPYVTWLSEQNGFRGVYVKKWDGTNWVGVNGLPGFSKLNSASAVYTTLTLDKNGNPIVAWAEYIPGSDLYSVKVKQWNGVQWSTVRNIGNVSSYKISLAVSSNNTIYVAAAQGVSVNGKTLSMLRVHYRSAGMNKTLGGYLNQNSNAYSPVVKIGSNDNPVVVWYEVPDSILVSNDIAIKRWNGSAWESFGSEIEDYYFDSSTNPDLVLRTNNSPILSFTTNKSDGNLENIVVKQY